MRILIIGASGMLGHRLYYGLGTIFPETYATVRCSVSRPPYNRIACLQSGKVVEHVDATNFTRLASVIRKIKPDVVINCIGIIKQRGSACSPIAYITLNSLLPHRIAEQVADYGGRLIHFSTDCVFDGKAGGYTEADIPNAADLYGRTKILGEVVDSHALVIRTSFIGREITGHASLLDWFLSQRNQSIQGYTKAVFSGLTTVELVNIVAMIIDRFPSLNGIYHVAAPPITKYDLLAKVRDVFNLPVAIEPSDELRIDRSLQAARFENATGYQPPGWDHLLEQLAADSDLYRTWGIPS